MHRLLLIYSGYGRISLQKILLKDKKGMINLKLGAYYYDGWYEYRGNWRRRLLEEFDCRQPVWGWLGNSVENMEKQIDYAAKGGLSFFAFDWYYPEGGGEERGNNRCIDRYLQSRNAGLLEFCLLICNHQGAFIYYDTWKDACRRWMRFLTNEHALKVNGKPVIIFFSAYNIVEYLGGREKARECFDYLRDECVKAGLPGCFIMGCMGGQRGANGGTSLEKEQVWRDVGEKLYLDGFDAITGYNYHRTKTTYPDGSFSYLLPFDELAKDHELVWEGHCRFGKLPYMPCLTGGWDNRPNENPEKPEGFSCHSPDITPISLYKHILRCGEFQKQYKDKVLEDLAIIYAWNENGEGGFICPTKGFHNDGLLMACERAVEEINAEKQK